MEEPQEQGQPKVLTYGAILALVLYFGGISPWQSELDEGLAQLERDRRAAAKPTRFRLRAQRAKKELDDREGRMTGAMCRLVGKVGIAVIDPPPASQAFPIVMAVAGESGLAVPDLRPLSKQSNDFLAETGCAFQVSAPREQDVYRFLRRLEAHPSGPRLRSLTLQHRRGLRGEGDTVVADLAVGWVRLRGAGARAVRSMRLATAPLVAAEDLDGWALFGPKPVVVDASAASAPVATAPEAAPEEAPPPEAPDDGSEAVSALDLTGTITVNGIDGIIIALGGKQRILQLGDGYGGFTLNRVLQDTAVFIRNGKTVKVRLVRRSLVGRAPQAEQPSALLAARPKLGIRAAFVDCGRVAGGQGLVDEGFRRGLLVRSIADESLAQTMRMETNDLIFAIDGQKIRTPTQLRQATVKAGAGDRVTFNVLRRGVRMTIASTRS